MLARAPKKADFALTSDAVQTFEGAAWSKVVAQSEVDPARDAGIRLAGPDVSRC